MLCKFMDGIQVKKDDAFFTCREKFYPDGTVEILVCDQPIFSHGGWENSKRRFRNSRLSGSEESDPRNLERSARRAAAKVRDLALCNSFQTFVTLTLDGSKIDRYDRAEITKKVQTWCDNKVRRNGLRYVLVPELHQDGALHFHGFFGWDSAEEKDRWLVDSGTISVPGKKKPVRAKSPIYRTKLLQEGGHIVYNLPAWTLGFTTAVELYGDYHAAVAYTCKYIRKQQDAGKICGRWYYHGGCTGQPEIKLENQFYDDFLDYPDAYHFVVPEAGLRFVRIIVKGEQK